MINTCTVSGNLTRDPEQRQAGNSTVVSVAIANNRRWPKAGTGGNTGVEPDWQESTTYFEINVWKRGLQNQIMNDLAKGDPVIVTARIDQNDWQDKDTGANRSRHELTVTDGSHDIIAVRKYTPRNGGGQGGGFGGGNGAPAQSPNQAFASDEPGW